MREIAYTNRIMKPGCSRINIRTRGIHIDSLVMKHCFLPWRMAFSWVSKDIPLQATMRRPSSSVQSSNELDEYCRDHRVNSIDLCGSSSSLAGAHIHVRGTEINFPHQGEQLHRTQ